jgi:hypothetical protein
MVLKKVGEYNVGVNVNGNQKIDDVISDDKVYDLTANPSINYTNQWKVEGQLQGWDATYDDDPKTNRTTILPDSTLSGPLYNLKIDVYLDSTSTYDSADLDIEVYTKLPNNGVDYNGDPKSQHTILQENVTAYEQGTGSGTFTMDVIQNIQGIWLSYSSQDSRDTCDYTITAYKDIEAVPNVN